MSTSVVANSHYPGNRLWAPVRFDVPIPTHDAAGTDGGAAAAGAAGVCGGAAVKYTGVPSGFC